MVLLLVLIAIELAALLHVAYRVWDVLETKIWDNTATIDGNMSDATSAILDIRDAIVPQPDEPDHTTDDLPALARRIDKTPKGTLSEEQFARLTVDALNRDVKSNDSE
jgi:hypothetical protein